MRNDSVIFISIDDNQQANLQKICDEIFGKKNFANNISIKMSELSGVKMKHFHKYSKIKETLLIYAKNINLLELIVEKKIKSEETLSNYLKYYSSIIENIDEECYKWEIISLQDYLPKSGLSFYE